MINCVLFDLDGVIIDSTPVMKYAFSQSYKNLVDAKKTPPFEEFIKHSGNSLINIFKKMKLPVELMYKEFRKHSIENIDKIAVFEPVIELIKKLNLEKFKIGIVTGKEKDRTIMILEKHGIIKYFDTIVASNEVSNPKPDPESILMALKNIEANPDEAIYIGDAENDILAATSANLKSIAVTWGVESIDQLKQYNPNYIVDNADEIYQIIINYNLSYDRTSANKSEADRASSKIA